MKRTSHFQPHAITRTVRDGGRMLLTSDYALNDCAEKSGEWLHRWASTAPDRVFLAERSGDGWREDSYATTLQQVRALAAALLGRGMGPATPILVMSGNSVDHGLLSLAAQYIGAPIVPIAEQYSLIEAAHPRLVHAIELVRPKLAYVCDAKQFSAALALDAMAGIEVIASIPGANTSVTPMADLLKGDKGVDLDAAYDAVTPDSVAKILMTSGSTSAPKGVLTTQRMMCVNQTQLASALPFLSEKPPRLLDWLPWNHVFGGSHNFNMMLANGGSLYIDDGKPTPALFDRTLRNLRDITGTLSFNVPLGYDLLAKALANDGALRQRFFGDLDLIFYAGASLPQDVWQALEQMAFEVKGEVPLMTSSWGLTETAPAVMLQSEPIDRSGVVGVPLPGITLKLLPDDDMRCEVRVKGPNVMPGYFEAPDKTDEAFDEEGFFITGDAMVFLDPDDPNQGMRFDGRMSEDFKLLSGTWVRAGQLRLDVLAALGPLAADLVVTGADKDEIGVMIFPNPAQAAHMSAQDGAVTDADVLEQVRTGLAAYSKAHSSSSTRVARAIVLSEPASLADSEITAKGNLNFRKILIRRAGLLALLYDTNDTPVIEV